MTVTAPQSQAQGSSEPLPPLRDRAVAALRQREEKNAATHAEMVVEARAKARSNLESAVALTLGIKLTTDEGIEVVDVPVDPWSRPRAEAFITLDDLRFTSSYGEFGHTLYVVRPCSYCGEDELDKIVEHGGLADLGEILKQKAFHVSCEREAAAKSAPPAPPAAPTPLAQLQAKRREIATLNQRLGRLDRERRAKRVELENQYRAQMNPSTNKPYTQEAAGDAAATDATYVPLLTTIDAVTFERDLLVAEGEAMRLSIDLEISAARTVD